MVTAGGAIASVAMVEGAITAEPAASPMLDVQAADKLAAVGEPM
jgi:hypothetical protein